MGASLDAENAAMLMQTIPRMATTELMFHLTDQWNKQPQSIQEHTMPEERDANVKVDHDKLQITMHA